MQSKHNFSFRRCTLADKDFVIHLHHTTLREYIEPIYSWNESKWTEIISSWFDPEKIQIIVSGSSDIGILVLLEKPGALHFESISLLTECQGKGIGSAIIQDIMAIARSKKLPITLSVLKTNTRAKRLYESFGFQEFKQDQENFWLKYTVD